MFVAGPMKFEINFLRPNDIPYIIIYYCNRRKRDHNNDFPRATIKCHLFFVIRKAFPILLAISQPSFPPRFLKNSNLVNS